MTPDPDLRALADALAEVGRRVRDTVLAAAPSPSDRNVVRHEGGDDIFGLDVRADEVLQTEFESIGARWPGHLVMEVAGGRSKGWLVMAVLLLW